MQKRTARFETGNYDYETESMTGILGKINWEYIKKRRKDNRLVLLYKGLKVKSSLPTDGLIPLTRSGRNHHSIAFQTLTAGIDIYKVSKGAKISNRYNQELHLTLDTNGKVTNSQPASFHRLLGFGKPSPLSAQARYSKN